MKHYLLAGWRLTFDLMLRWLWFSYRVNAATGKEQLLDVETHYFRACPGCNTFIGTISHTHRVTCPRCGITPYQLTTEGVVYEKETGMFATRTRRFVLTHTLHNPFISWLVVLFTLVSVAFGTYASNLFRTPLDDCVHWFATRNESVQTYVFITLVTVATCCLMLYHILHKKADEPPPLFAASITLVILAFGIICYGVLYILSKWESGL